MPRPIPITTLQPDEKVRRKGAYIMPLWRYHGDCASIPSISSSGLVEVANNGEEFYAESHYNPAAPVNTQKEHKVHTPAFTMGHAAHCAVVGGADWTEEFVTPPNDFPGSWRSEKWKEWRWFQEVRKGKIVITKEDIKHVNGMVERIQDHALANALFTNGIPEVSLFHSHDGIIVKCRPDVLPVVQDRKDLDLFHWMADVVSDYKTTFDNSPGNCRSQIIKHGYDMKLANVAWAAVKLFDVNFGDLSFGLVFQKTTPPYGITPVEVDPDGDYMHMLVARNMFAASRFAKGMAVVDGHWDGYLEETLNFKPSGSFMDTLRKHIDEGTYPNIDHKLRIVQERN